MDQITIVIAETLSKPQLKDGMIALGRHGPLGGEHSFPCSLFVSDSRDGDWHYRHRTVPVLSFAWRPDSDLLQYFVGSGKRDHGIKVSLFDSLAGSWFSTFIEPALLFSKGELLPKKEK